MRVLSARGSLRGCAWRRSCCAFWAFLPSTRSLPRASESSCGGFIARRSRMWCAARMAAAVNFISRNCWTEMCRFPSSSTALMSRPQSQVTSLRYASRLRLDGRPVIAFVGRLVAYKGADEFVAALEALERLRPGAFQAVLVGSGPLRDELEARIARSRLAGRVHLAGAVAHAKSPRILLRPTSMCRSTAMGDCPTRISRRSHTASAC